MKLSILTVAYNALPDLKISLEPLFAQNEIELEFVVIDGGSHDGTKEYLENLKQKNLKFVFRKRQGHLQCP